MSDPEQGAARVLMNNARRPGHRVEQFHAIYDPDELVRAIGQLTGIEEPYEFPTPTGEAPSLSPEDANRLRVLQRMAADPRGHRRRLVIGSTDMVRRISDLSPAMPHFAPAIDAVARAALVATRTATPLRLPPILLLGAPGVGKTYAMRALAAAIGTDCSLLAANITDSFRLRGLPVSYRGAKMGRVSEILLGASAAPVVIVDEIDKAIGDAGGHGDGPYDAWHSLLERENAEAFRDDYLELDMRADRVLWIATANDVATMPDSILDRFLIIDIPTPTREQLGIVIASIYTRCRQTYGGGLPECLSEDVVDELVRHNPRRAGRLLDLAVGFAAAAGRRSVIIADIRSADRLAGDARNLRAGFRGPIGFTRSQTA